MNPKNENLDPQLQTDSEILRTDKLRERYGEDTVWDKEFGGLDDSAEKARAATQRMKDHLAASGANPEQPMRFSVSIAGRSVPIQVKENNGEFSCTMPIEVTPGQYEYRTLLASSYSGLIGSVNRSLRATPQVRDLTPQESIELARTCTMGRKLDAVLWKYLELRLGPNYESMLNNPRFLYVTDDAIIFILAHSDPTFPNTPEAINFVRKYAAGRPLTLPLAKAAFKAFQEQKRTGAQTEATPQVSDAELERASDKELRESMRGLARARADADRKRRELVYGRGQ